MDWASRLLCEGWTEKQVFLPLPDSPKRFSNKWKSRYATVTLIHSNAIEIKFYPKKPKSSTELSGERITLIPWRYCISLCQEPSKSHGLKIMDYESGLTKPCTRAAILSLQSSEEAVAWLRCIQTLTKLEPGMERNKFSVITNNAEVFHRLYAIQSHCILHISSELAALALKNDQSVLVAWPLTSIRTYGSHGPSHFTITAGRSAPHGEGLYQFQTADGDAAKLFRLMDFYTGVTNKIETDAPERVRPGTLLPLTSTSPYVALPCPQEHGTPRGYLPMSPQTPPPKPPRKPPLPERKKPLSFTRSSDSLTSHVTPMLSPVRSAVRREISEPGFRPRVSAKPYSMADPEFDGMSDLDNLLKMLESNLPAEDRFAESAIGESVADICKEALQAIVDLVVRDVDRFYVGVQDEAAVDGVDDSHGYETMQREADFQGIPNRERKCEVSDPTSYSSVNYERKSIKRAAKVQGAA